MESELRRYFDTLPYCIDEQKTENLNIIGKNDGDYISTQDQIIVGITLAGKMSEACHLL